MSYTPTSWNTGDTITAAAMNKIENGIANAGGALICNLAYNDDLGEMALDKTVQEIYDAFIGGTPVYVKYQYGVLGTDYTGNVYLAPVVKIYNYNYTDLIRVAVLKPTKIPSKGSLTDIYSPSIATFTASGLNAYPVYYINTYAPATYINAEPGEE